MVAELPAGASEEDLLYEEDILRNAYSLRYWTRYIDAKKRAPARQRNLVAERALKYLPGSYKIWRPYLNDRREQVKNRPPDDPAIEAVNRTYERALVYMHKMPRIWEEYLSFLAGQYRLTFTRHAFDRALRALPITQHERVWKLYLAFAKACPVKETAVRIYRRYLQFEPEAVEEYIDFLLSIGRVSEAALKLAELLNKENVVSLRGKSRHSLWMELCELVCKNPEHVKALRVESIIRSGLRTFSDEAGHLWCALADFFIRQASFEQARDVYEEGVASVLTVRDFSLIFDAYTQFEETMLTAKLEGYGDADLTDDQQLDVDMRLARLERLMERRPELLSSVLLRQSPHNVQEWLKRASIFEGDAAKVIHT
jgi:pre-mRNA-splicing factor SYF1